MLPGPYTWLMLAGILVSACLWSRTARRDPRLPLIYVAALLGAMLGAKLAYLLAEGWNDLGQPDVWRRLATGKSILGGLLLGYPAVEFAKSALGYRTATGDWFALVTPVGVGFGRVGCLLQGCCPGQPCPPSWYSRPDPHGVHRWPAVPLELAFNIAALVVLGLLHRGGRLPGQLFHLYLAAYGTFRFLHEFVRDTPRIPGLAGLSGYHLAALGLIALGILGYRNRARSRFPSPGTSALPAPLPPSAAP